MKKRKHHYIWQFYLDAWLDKAHVWCLRDKVFPSATINVAQARDFYRLKRLNSNEIFYLKYVINNAFPKDMVNIHLDILWRHTRPFYIEDYFLENDLMDDDSKKCLDEMINDTEEDFHSLIEGGEAQNCLRLLRLGDGSFWGDLQQRITFLHFLALQYFRTKKVQESIILKSQIFAELETAKRLDLDMGRMWGVNRHMLAMNLTNSIYKDPEYSLVILEDVSGVGFIAGDSVAVNTYGVDGRDELLEFYYPVSPRFAALVTDRKFDRAKVEVGLDVVNVLNMKMLDYAHEMVFSNRRDQLEQHAEYFINLKSKAG